MSDASPVRPRRRSPEGAAVAGLLAALAARCATGAGASASLYTVLKGELRAAVAADPIDTTVATVLGGALAFYTAEKGHNPKVTTYWDALVFVSTCLSVGYADVFARTPAGKAIASAIMTVGPALSGALLEAPRGRNAAPGGPSEQPDESGRIQAAMLEKLDAILVELRRARSPG